MQENPLIEPIRRILSAQIQPISEHELIKKLAEHGLFDDALFSEETVGLFRRHFLVMNALYQLQEMFAPTGIYLHISALQIKTEITDKNSASTHITENSDAGLRAYYKNWDNFYHTQASDVEALLDGFWKRFVGHDKKTASLSVLGLDTQADWPLIEKTYRRLAQQHHPDKGGNADQFVAIATAYQHLVQAYAR